MSIGRAAQFLSNTSVASPDAVTPEAQLLTALGQSKLIALREVAARIGVSADQAGVVVGRLLNDGKAVVLERSDRPGQKYLSAVRG